MSLIDKVVAAVTPPESDESRAEARAKARAAARTGDWLSLVLEHHQQIESAFAAVKGAGTAAARTAAQKRLGVLLTGHSNAEESVLYPGLALADEKSDATTAYAQQAAAKTEMAALENIPPMSQEYLDKLEHIRGAVAHHVYEEEGTWFPALHEKTPAAEQAKLTKRYREEFERYVGDEEILDDARPPARAKPARGASSHDAR
jgi:hemerythrin superfamily protein